MSMTSKQGLERLYSSGTPLIRTPMGQKKMAVVTGWPYLRGYFLQENVWRFLPGGHKKLP